MSISDNSKDAERALTDHLLGRGLPVDYVNQQRATLFDLGGYRSRFIWIDPVVPATSRTDLLISGVSVGSEIAAAIEFGYERITGTEVDPTYVAISRRRFQENRNVIVLPYDGEVLPFPAAQFTIVVSGHIIEHTSDPERYLLEHLRVLRPSGFLFIEYPSRYHHTELHTGVPSVEWLPHRLRSWALQVLVSRLSPLDVATRAKYRAIQTTLQPISWPLLRKWMTSSGIRFAQIAQATPAPGIKRLVIQKL